MATIYITVAAADLVAGRVPFRTTVMDDRDGAVTAIAHWADCVSDIYGALPGAR